MRESERKSEYDPVGFAKRRMNGEPDDLPGNVISLEDATLPEPSTPYEKAYGTSPLKPVLSLHCLMGKDGYESFSYGCLAKNHKFRYLENGQEIVLEFTDGERVRLIIRGRNLLKMYDYLLRSRCTWMRMPLRDFEQNDDATITSISIEEVKEESPRE